MLELYQELKAEVTKFCHSEPAPGYEVSYLERAEQVLDLHRQAGEILETSESEENNEKLQMILNDLKKITE